MEQPNYLARYEGANKVYVWRVLSKETSYRNKMERAFNEGWISVKVYKECFPTPTITFRKKLVQWGYIPFTKESGETVAKALVKAAKPAPAPKPVDYTRLDALGPHGKPDWRKKDFERIAAVLRKVKPVMQEGMPGYTPYDHGKMEAWQRMVHAMQLMCADNSALGANGPVFDPDAFAKAVL